MISYIVFFVCCISIAYTGSHLIPPLPLPCTMLPSIPCCSTTRTSDQATPLLSLHAAVSFAFQSALCRRLLYMLRRQSQSYTHYAAAEPASAFPPCSSAIRSAPKELRCAFHPIEPIQSHFDRSHGVCFNSQSSNYPPLQLSLLHSQPSTLIPIPCHYYPDMLQSSHINTTIHNLIPIVLPIIPSPLPYAPYKS